MAVFGALIDLTGSDDDDANSDDVEIVPPVPVVDPPATKGHTDEEDSQRSELDSQEQEEQLAETAALAAAGRSIFDEFDDAEPSGDWLEKAAELAGASPSAKQGVKRSAKAVGWQRKPAGSDPNREGTPENDEGTPQKKRMLDANKVDSPWTKSSLSSPSTKTSREASPPAPHEFSPGTQSSLNDFQPRKTVQRQTQSLRISNLPRKYQRNLGTRWLPPPCRWWSRGRPRRANPRRCGKLDAGVVRL